MIQPPLSALLAGFEGGAAVWGLAEIQSHFRPFYVNDAVEAWHKKIGIGFSEIFLFIQIETQKNTVKSRSEFHLPHEPTPATELRKWEWTICTSGIRRRFWAAGSIWSATHRSSKSKFMLKSESRLSLYEFIEGLIKKDLADRNQPDEEVNHVFVPILDGEALAVDGPITQIKTRQKDGNLLFDEVGFENPEDFVQRRHLLAKLRGVVQ